MTTRKQRLRQEAAIERKAVAKNRTPEEQLRLLDSRLGKGIGATKERSKLIRKIHAKNKKA